ncbi:MAG: TIM-barrel domain-containing protein [Thermoflexales bacterium]
MKSGASRRLGLSFLTALIVLAAGHLVAPPGEIKSSGFVSQGDVLIASSGAAQLRVQVVAPDAVRLSVRLGGDQALEWEQSAPGGGTLVISPNFAPEPGSILSTAYIRGRFEIRTRMMRISVQRAPLEVDVFDAGGRRVVKATSLESGRIDLLHDAPRFYGIHASDVWGNIEDRLSRPDGGVVTAGIQGNALGPWIFSPQFGVLVDSAGGQFFADPGRLSYRDDQARAPDYFLLVGEPKTLMSRLSAISGRPPMLPKWALGFINSQWGLDQAQLESVVATYQRSRIPLSAFGLDFDYKAWGEDNFGEFRWNRAKFPDGASGALADRLRRLSVNLIGIMKPRIIERNADGSVTTAGRALTALDCWYPGQASYTEYFSKLPARDVNFSRAACREWYWEQSRSFFDTGIRGWWNDEADINSEQLVFDPFQAINMARALYEGQRSASDLRVFTLNRSFFAGAQRYAYALWSGDIESNFDSMARQPVRMLASLNLGAASWTMDAGGFINQPPASSETYARWMQFGAFTPLFRVHAYENEARQPWLYGPQAEEIATDAIRMRSRFLPYIYAYERQKHLTGIGLVRPMFYEFPAEAALANATGEWMFGEHLLVSPVMAAGQTSHTIVLPPGDWTHYATGERYVGPGEIQLPIDAATWRDVPLLIREGAILPTRAGLGAASDNTTGPLIVDVFPSPAGSQFPFYDDDGSTYGYERGAYFSQRMSQQKHAGAVRFTTDQAEGTYEMPPMSYRVQLHDTAAISVTANGIALANIPSETALGAAVSGWMTARDRYGDLTIVKIPAGIPVQVIAHIRGGRETSPVAQARPNLAFEKSAVVSSTEDPRFRASNALDGDSNTRWSSLPVDGSWFMVDLGGATHVTEVTLNWETATARDYTLQIADDPDGPWREMARVVDNQTVGKVEHRVAGQGQYLRVSMTRRSGDWGYSLYDLAVRGAPARDARETITACPSAVTAQLDGWRDIPGVSVADLKRSPRIAGVPDLSRIIRRLEIDAPDLSNYGIRIRGEVCAPRSGFYTLSLASDDASEMRIDAALASGSAPVNSQVLGWTGSREWRKEPYQRSAPVFLRAGRAEPFEIWWKLGPGNGHLDVAWEGPGLPRQIIGGR